MTSASFGRTSFAAFIVAFSTLAGCAPRISSLDMAPMEFNAFSTPDGIRVDTMDPEILFGDGAAAFDRGDWNEAARLFGLVASRFPESDQGGPALFNFGLARLRSGRPGEAVAAFRKYIDVNPPAGDDLQPRLRLIEALLESGEWVDAEREILTCMAVPALPPSTTIELRAGLARALRKQDRLQEALDSTRLAMETYDAHAVEPAMKGNYSAAMASFEGGEIWHDIFLSIKLILPKDRMEKDLTDKAAMFMKAQSEYMRTVRVGNIFWSSRAGVRIGQLYEEFYNDIMSAEVPPGLNATDLGRYMNELRRQARPLLEKAVVLYERNMEVCRKFGAKEEWFAEMKSRLARLKDLLRDLSAM